MELEVVGVGFNGGVLMFSGEDQLKVESREDITPKR